MKKEAKVIRQNFFDVIGQVEGADYGSFIELIYSNKKRKILNESNEEMIKNYSWRKAQSSYLYVKKRKLHVFFYTKFCKVKHKKVKVPEGNIYVHENYISIVKNRKIIAVYTPELKLVMRNDERIHISNKDQKGRQYCRSTSRKRETIFLW